MSSGDSLLDVFVRILPEPNSEQLIRDAVARTQAMFGQMTQSANAATAAATRALNTAARNAGGGSGGSGGGGTGGGNGLAQQYREALRAAQDLAIETGRIGAVVRQIGNDNLSQDFRLAANQLKDIQVLMRRGREDSDPLALDVTLERLELVRQRLNEIRQASVGASFVGTDQQQRFNSIIETERINRPNFQIDVGVRRAALQGLDFKAKQELNELIATAQKAEIQFESLRRTFVSTGEGLENLAAQSVQLEQFRTAVLDKLNETAQTGGRSFNTLSNSAYQLGQAFEDAAVGFSLNGFAGAIRGSANNIAFILNDMSRIDVIQKALPAGWAKQLPLIAGIGSALAILVLPRLFEWLESLNDIEGKFRDISDEIAASFEDRDFRINFGLENAELQQSIGSAETVLDILKQIRELDFQAKNKSEQIKQIFVGLEDLELFGDEETAISKIQGQVARLFEITQRQVEEQAKKISEVGPTKQLINDNFVNTFFGVFGAESDTSRLSGLKAFRDEIFSVQRLIQQTFDDGQAGTATLDNIIRAQRLIAELQKSLPEQLQRLDLDDDKAAIEALNGALTGYAGQLKEVEKLTREVNNTVEQQFVIAFDAAVKKVGELQTKLDVTRNVARGFNVDFDLDLLALDTQINEGRRIVIESIEAIRDEAKKRGIPVDEQGIQAIQNQFALESQISIEQLQSRTLKEREAIEKRILDIKERQNKAAKSTTLEEFSKQLQLTELSRDRSKEALQDEQRKLDILDESLLRIRGAGLRNAAGLRFEDIAAGRRDVPVGFFENGRRVGGEALNLDRESMLQDFNMKFDEHTRKVVEAIMANKEAVERQDKVPRAQ